MYPMTLLDLGVTIGDPWSLIILCYDNDRMTSLQDQMSTEEEYEDMASKPMDEVKKAYVNIK